MNDAPDYMLTHAMNLREVCLRLASRVSAPDPLGDSESQFRVWMVRTTNSMIQPIGVSVAHVLKSRRPFQIAQMVISLVPIFVIALLFICSWTDERLKNESRHLSGDLATIIQFQSNLEITARIEADGLDEWHLMLLDEMTTAEAAYSTEGTDLVGTPSRQWSPILDHGLKVYNNSWIAS
jgi:hypothetical protein